MKKIIYFSPLIITFVGVLYGLNVQPRTDPAYLFGFGLGFMLTAAVPASLVALVHYFFGKKKSEVAHHLAEEIIDTESTKNEKSNYLYLLCLYTGIIGLLISLLMLANRLGT
ncbi:MAG: hypothetical protein R2780_02315 [Crocinitomicaceae bacterium]|nr:hypothetical protein [Crocinitomicaceae bacterium]